MESEAVAAVRRELDALANENRERLDLATQRVQESDAKAEKAFEQQRSSIQNLVKRFRESAAAKNGDRKDRETYAFGRNEEDAPPGGSSRRWPGAPEDARRRPEPRKPVDDDDEDEGTDAPRDRRKMRSWEQSWTSDDEPRPAEAAQAPEPARPPRRRPQQQEIDDEDMSGQSWMR